MSPGERGITWSYNGLSLGKPIFRAVRNTSAAVFECGLSILCVEHLMAALFLADITDVNLHVRENPELPFLDGSASEYVRALSLAVALGGDCKRPISVSTRLFNIDRQRGSWFLAEPATRLLLRASTDFPEPLGRGVVTLCDLDADQLARARSFIREPIDVVTLEMACNRLKGLRYALDHDAIILWSTKSILTPLRLDCEWRYHKLLDLIGDLTCDGTPLLTEITAHRPGHYVNHQFREGLTGNVTSS